MSETTDLGGDSQDIAGDIAYVAGRRSPGASPRLIQAVDRAMQLLNAVACSPSPSTVPELAKMCGLNRSTAWRLLNTLEHHGIVERDPLSQRYHVGYGTIRLATATVDHRSLVRRARPVLERLADETGETVNLGVGTFSAAVCIDQVDAGHVISLNWIGRQMPLHCTSIGLAVLSYLPESERESVLQQPRKAYTKLTLVDEAQLREVLARVRDRGFCVAVDDYETGIGGVTAPVLDAEGRASTLVSVSGPSFRLPRTTLETLGPRVAAAAAEIGRRLRKN